MLEKDIQEILFSEEQLASRVNEIARQITQDYQGKEIVLISVLRGSFVFMADLCRRIDLPCTVDFMAVSSYGSGTSSTGQVQITKDLSSDIAGKHIIVVEDILDSGNTLSYLLKLLAQRKPASIRLCTLLDKPERRTKPVEVHYSGFTIPDAFVVGYGLDYAEHYRNLPYIGILKPEVYGGWPIQAPEGPGWRTVSSAYPYTAGKEVSSLEAIQFPGCDTLSHAAPADDLCGQHGPADG